MIVFKLYFKIVSQTKFMIFVYLGVFIFLAVMTSTTQAPTKVYQDQLIDISWIDHDETELTNSLKSYIGNYAKFEEIKQDKIDEALFYRDILVYIEIPEGFSAKLATTNETLINIKVVPGAIGAYHIENAINRYLNIARSLIENELYLDNLTVEITKALEPTTNVIMTQDKVSNFSQITFFFGYASYIIMALLIPIISTIMYALKSLEIKRRNNLGSLSNAKLQGILMLCNLILGISLILVLLCLGIILYRDTLFTRQGLLFTLNALIFSLTIISLAYLIATIFKSQMVIGALSNIISLGLSFITGIFIPQELLGKSLLSFARIFPSYWYIALNNQIQSITSFSYQAMKPFYQNALIQLLYIVIFMSISLIISKKQMRDES